PYTYQWDNNAGNQTTQTASGLFAGLYAVTITDSIGCSGIAFVLVNNITTPVVSDSTSNASCYGNCDGQISLSVTGNSPFTYIWSNGDTTSSQGSLCPGTYYVTVTDSAGCLGVYSYSISQPPKLSLSMSQTLDYGGGTGTATATPSGGTPPYSYLWDANTGNQTDQTATGLSGGNYSVTVSDSLGCTENGNIIVTGMAIGKGMESISLFPNPASGYFTLVIRNAASRFYIIRIFNELGQELHTDYIANSKQITSTFDISRFGKGVLFVSITSGQGTVFKKLICTK
ncbi:MAG: T9SS type A sorting domain-containing protein, partial [Flavobacteriales bacterium]